jgi:uncharacterized protein (TIGR02271 family)
MANTLVGVYSDLQQAYQVISQLRQAGFSANDISIVSNEIHGSKQHGFDDQMRKAFGDLKQQSLPGIGNVYASGPLARNLSGNPRLVDALGQIGADTQDAEFYLEALRRGNTLVAVSADGAREQPALDIMTRFNPLPMQRVSEHWRESGWKGYDANANPFTAQDMDREGQQILPIIEEELRVGKREVERGGVRVHARMAERPVEKSVDLREEKVNVERRPADRPATDADLQAFQEGSFEVRETAEEPVVDKQARVTEEVVVDKDIQQRQEVVRDTERHTEVDVERLSGTSGGTTFNPNDPDFRKHYETYFSRSNMPYERIQPAYQYGYSYGGRYQGRTWNEVEAQARRDWQQQNPDSKWEQYKDAVREGFERARSGSR